MFGDKARKQSIRREDGNTTYGKQTDFQGKRNKTKLKKMPNKVVY